jgi:hypothetical protein
MTLLFVAVVELILGVILLSEGFTDGPSISIWLATLVTVAGLAIAYLGQPTVTRYRIGLVVVAIGVVTSFWLLLT